MNAPDLMTSGITLGNVVTIASILLAIWSLNRSREKTERERIEADKKVGTDIAVALARASMKLEDIEKGLNGVRQEVQHIARNLNHTTERIAVLEALVRPTNEEAGG